MVCKDAFRGVLWSCLMHFGHEKKGGKQQYGLTHEGGQNQYVAHLRYSFLFSKCMRTKSCMENACLGHLGKGKEGGACDGMNLVELFGIKCAKLG